jgi:hypothetical protein
MVLKMLTTKQNRSLGIPWLKCGEIDLKVNFIPTGTKQKN